MKDLSYLAVHKDLYISLPSRSSKFMKLYPDAEFYLVREVVDTNQVFRIVDANGTPTTYLLSCGELYGFILNASNAKPEITLEIKDRIAHSFVRYSQILECDNIDIKTIIESVFAVVEQYAVTQIVPNNEIWYKTSDGKVVEFNSYCDEEIDYVDNFGANLISNTYISGRGILLFDNNVTKVGEAFNHSNLTSIYLPNCITEVDDGAFDGCEYLEQFISILASDDRRCLIINNEVKAFAPAGLMKYSIPQGVKKINYCFNDRKHLTELDIPDGVIDLSVDGCSRLSSIYIPNSIQSLEFCAFGDCHSLSSVEIPNGINKIGVYCFENCHNLTRVIIPDSVTRIEDGAFVGCGSLNDIVLPKGTTYIGSQAFENCFSLSKITLPITLKQINSYIFKGCENLKCIEIPDTIECIGEECFRGCKRLKEATIGKSVSSIERSAFQGCSRLSQLYCKAIVPPKIEPNIFGKGRPKCKIYVPMQSVALYKKSKGWRLYSDYIEGCEYE